MTEIYRSLGDYPQTSSNLVLTIGNFDGLHLGHQALLNAVKHLAARSGGKSGAITFENHSSTVIHPGKELSLLCTSAHKLHLLKKMDLDLIFFLYFSTLFSQQTAEEFLVGLKEIVSVQALVLGHDSAFGKNRGGDRKTIKKLAKQLDLKIIYIDEAMDENRPISSSRVREYLQQGNLHKVSQLLDRKFSVFGPVVQGAARGKELGFPTANISVEGLCLPPYGVYAITMGQQKGIANLGIAPTVHRDRHPMLEVFLFDFTGNLYGQEVEVILEAFIRPEKKFNNLSELKQQIGQDITQAKKLLDNP